MVGPLCFATPVYSYDRRHQYQQYESVETYVDDTIIAECVHKKEGGRIQSDVEELIAKSNQNTF